MEIRYHRGYGHGLRPGTTHDMYPTPTVPVPTQDDVLEMLEDAVMDNEINFETSDGCEVEADGTCSHGHPTWLVRFGLI